MKSRVQSFLDNLIKKVSGPPPGRFDACEKLSVFLGKV